MLPNPFSEVGKVYDEVRQLQRELHSKANTWDISSLQNKIDTLSQDVRNINESIMNIYNKLDNHDIKLTILEEGQINMEENNENI